MIRPRLLLLLATLLAIQSSCSVENKELAAPVSVVRSIPDQPPDDSSEDPEKLRMQLAYRSSEVAHLRLQLLVKEAEINQVMRSHEQALQEVVRANAKLRNLDSRADTVAKIAEASMIINTVKESTANDQRQTITHAENLLASSQEALEEGNFNGASYLAGKAVNLIQPLRAPPDIESRVGLEAGETVFATPLLLLARKPSNVREKPGRDSLVLFELKKGQAVQAKAYSGLWIRITSDEGKEGWVYYYLLELKTP